MYRKLLNKETRLSVIGLGYVGLPLALEFAKKLSVTAFDQSEERVKLLKVHTDPGGEMASSEFDGCDIEFTSDPARLAEASFHIIAVPTPVDDSSMPDISYLIAATQTVARFLRRGDYVVYESTVYPGATEEDCIPVLEQISKMVVIKDFKVGYSPERINPGDKIHTLKTVVKIVSGCDIESLEIIAKIYEMVVDAGVHRASCIKVAEAAKIIENTQRDVNIALMNELSIIFNRMGINTYEVLEAAGTKWNFLMFHPGLVGGHCIGVDPYYLAYKARKYRYHPQVINAGRFVNDTMGYYVAKQTVKKMIAQGKNILNSRVLVMGITFKENVSDIRNSRVRDIVVELKSYGVDVEVYDPRVSPAEAERVYGFTLISHPTAHYDTVIVAVAHEEFRHLTEDYFKSITAPIALLVDVKGIYRTRIKNIAYWSL
ncbi:MAG: nucleotide sugar dehydrogenase [Bacteroidetes bacterium]|nr:nucleotide sugar dehydrogenase [Bacteroidota bacterium]